MATITSIHSFRRGTGKSLLAANVAALVANKGRRVGVIDANLLSPSLHIFFHLGEGQIRYTLNDYLSSKCGVEQIAYEVLEGSGVNAKGRIVLVPASTNPAEIMHILREPYNMDLFSEGIHALGKALGLDIIMVDNYAGLSEDTLLSIAMSKTAVIVMSPDKQHYQGTGVMIETSRRLGVPRIMLAINEVPTAFDPAKVKEQAEQAYECDVAALIPHSEHLMAYGSSGIFAVNQPEHPITRIFESLATALVSSLQSG